MQNTRPEYVTLLFCINGPVTVPMEELDGNLTPGQTLRSIEPMLVCLSTPERYLLVAGKLRTYRIHLGNGNINGTLVDRG
jgi:hypothetical protein